MEKGGTKGFHLSSFIIDMDKDTLLFTRNDCKNHTYRIVKNSDTKLVVEDTHNPQPTKTYHGLCTGPVK